jgi:hypothetical protein
MSCSLRLGLAFVFAAAWVFPAIVSAQTEPAKEKKAQSPWLVSYSLTTKPGGESFKIAGPVEYFDHNERLLVTEVVTVGEGGTFSLTPEASVGYWHVDQKFRPKDGKTYTGGIDAAAFFRGTGKITRESIKLDVEVAGEGAPRDGLRFSTSSAGATWLLKPERTGPDFLAHGWAPYAYIEIRKTSLDYQNAVPRLLPVVETVEIFQLFPEPPADPKGRPSQQPADLAVEMKAKVIAEEPVKGDEKKFRPRIVYTSTVTNKGPSKAVGVVLLQHLPGSFMDISVKVGQGTPSGSHQLVCKLGDLASGATSTVEVTATSRIELSKVTIPFRSTGVVRSDVFDPNLSNNFATEVVKVDPKPK